MDDHEGHLDRETAERLLDGRPAVRPASPLAALLASAAAPGRPHELSNEDSVLMEFRAAMVSRPRPSRWRRLLTFKVIAAALAALAAGGLAFASSAGVLPAPFRDNPAPAPSPSTTAPGQRPASTPTPEPTTAITEEEVRGLCKAYLDKPGEERGKALQAPAFSGLVHAAGGADRVDAFCTQKEKEAEKEKADKSHPPRPSRSPVAEPVRPTPVEQGRPSTVRQTGRP